MMAAWLLQVDVEPRADHVVAYKDGKYIFPNDEVSGAIRPYKS